jgi:HlyD family secretion protein
MRILKYALIGVLLLLLAGGGVLYLSKTRPSDSKEIEPRYKEVTVAYGTFRVTVTADGVVKPIDRIEVKSKASGQIEELPVEQGDFVRKGDLIARLDQKDERAEVAKAQAELDIAKAELKQAQQTFKRRRELFAKGFISAEERDESERSLAVAKAKVVQTATTLDRARERLAESVVRAPADGIILQKKVEEGQIIASGVSNVSGGSPIVDLADMRFVHIEAGVDEIDIGKVRNGQTAVVVADAYPAVEFRGKVVRIAPEARVEQNVTLFNVIVEVENTDGKLKSGMNTTIRIAIVEKERVLLVPAMVLQAASETDVGKNARQVLVKVGDAFVPQPVEIGVFDFKQAEILSGLTEGSVLGVPMTSRLKEENLRLEQRIRSSRTFGKQRKKPASE